MQPDHTEDLVVAEPIILIFVGRYIGNDLSKVYPADVYAAVRGWWRGNTESREADNELVLARTTDRVVGAFRAKRWVASPFEDSRWGFVGEPAELDVQLRYVGRRVPNRFRVQAPVQYLDPES